MNRDKIVEMYKSRKKIHEKFSKDHGVITPIRAFDFSAYNDNYDSIWANSLLNQYARAIKVFSVDDEVEKFKLLKQFCNPVGYFVASPSDDGLYVKFGLSVCSIQDQFNKDRGLLKAFKQPYALPGIGQHPANLVKAFPEDEWFNRFKKEMKVFNDYPDSVIKVRYWPISFEDQYKLFKKRCSVYYKNIVK